ncbi:MAG: cell wall-binding repeat-containing protein [Gracilibacteraceae bacterium]|jgi:putative cell wall-binding protein|nr:cell wall-binding repeat-containing protein [Gracilibacteraceae bacterium]
MQKNKLIAVLAAAALLLMSLPAQIFAITSTSNSLRLAGADRVGTALESSVGWTAADNVVVAPADQVNLVDSLSAAPLAGQLKAPILLTFKNNLDQGVKNRIAELKVKKAYVIGAVTDTVAAQLREIPGLEVEVLRGATRWDTSDLINAKLTDVAGTFVVGYNAIADALSAASFAAAHRYQIVLTDSAGQAAPAKLKGTVYLIGGTGVVRDLPDVNAIRLGGADRYATNSKVVEALDYDFNKVYIANGVSLVDALAASSLAALTRSPILLTNSADIPALTNANVTNKLNAASAYVALGGTGAVSEAVMNSIGSGAGPIVVNSVQGTEENFNVRSEGQYLGVRINNSQKVTAAQLDAAGYDVLFTAEYDVFGGSGSSESDTGELKQGNILSVYQDGSDTCEYSIQISKKSELVAESSNVTVHFYDGRTTAAAGISSYRLDLVENGVPVLSQGIKSGTLVVGETAGFWNVKAKTIAGGTDVDITNSIKLSSSDPWVVDVNDDNNNPVTVPVKSGNRDYSKWLEALSPGKATITITSGAVTQSFTVTVRDTANDDGRVAAKAVIDSTNTMKLAVNSGFDYALIKFTDQYGDPFAKWEQVFFDKDGHNVELPQGGSNTFQISKYVSGSQRQVATAEVAAQNSKGELLVRVTSGDLRTSTEYLSFFGYKWEGASTYRELGKIKLDIGASGTLDPSKSKFVAADSDALEFTVDHNAFETARASINLRLMKYTSNGYALGAFTATEYAGWKETPSATPLGAAFALKTNRDGYILPILKSGQTPPVQGGVVMQDDIITVSVANTQNNSDVKSGSVQLQAVIKRGSGNTLTTKSQNIKIVNTVAQINKVTFESIDEMSGGDYDLSELLRLDNILTDKSMADGVLRVQADPDPGAAHDHVKIFYRNEAGVEQEIGRIVTNAAGSELVKFFANSNASDDDAASVTIRVDNSKLTTNKSIQFAVKKYGTNANVATKSIRILRY